MRLKVRSSIILFFVLFTISDSVAINKDSLWKVWNNKKYPDTTRLNAINDLAWEILYENPDSAFHLAQIQINYANKKKILKWASGGYNIQGISHAMRGNNKTALALFEKCIPLKRREKDRIGEAAIINNMALLNDNMGNYPKALELSFQALKIKEELKDTLGLASGYGNIAITYDNIKEFEKAYSYYEKGLALYKKLGKKRGIALTLHDMGINLKERGYIDSSLAVFLRSKKMFDEMQEENVQVFLNIGVLYMLKNNYSEAEMYMQKSISIGKQYDDLPNLAAAYGHLSDLYFRQKNFSQAIINAKTGLQISEEIGAFRQVFDNANWLYLSYKEKADAAQALFYFEKYIKAKDTLFNEDRSKDMARFEVQFEFDKKTAEDSISRAKEKEVSNAKIAQQDAEIRAKRNQQIFLFGGLGIVLIFAIFMYNRFKVTQKQKNLIERQKQQVEEQNALIQYQKHEVEEKNKEITDSINYAKRIQEAILPSRYSLTENLKNGFVLYKPKDIVAGDFYWLESLEASGSDNEKQKTKNSKYIFFAAADCTGHGVPGALVSVVCSNAISKALLEDGIMETGKILDRTRELVIERFSKSEENVKDGMDISLCRLDRENMKLQWSGANNPLWLIRNGELIETKPDKQPIGNYAEPKPFTTHNTELQKEDTIYIFTDGYEDQFGGEKGKKFKASKFKELLLSVQSEEMEKQKGIINDTFENWRGSLEQVDDVCIIGVKI